MLGIGCILAEMLNCSYNKDRFKSRAFFPGTSSYPLSPCKESKDNKDLNVNVIENTDQLKLILENLGV